MRKGCNGVRRIKFREGSALVGVEEACVSGECHEAHCHDPFQDLGHRFEEDNDAEGGWEAVEPFSWFVQDNPVGKY